MLSSQNASKATYLILLYYSFSRLHDLVYADPPYYHCPNRSPFADQSPFRKNLNNLLLSLASNAADTKFYNTSIGDDSDRVYGQFLCFGNETCHTCMTTAQQDIMKRCSHTKEAIVWEENCQLRYSNKNFFTTLDVTGNQVLKNQMNVVESERRRYRRVVKKILGFATQKATKGSSANMYAAANKTYTKSNTLYAVVQCTGDLSRDDCNTCLQTAIENVSSCCDYSRGVRVYSKSCYLRFELYPFGGAQLEENWLPVSNKRNIWIITIFVVSAFLAVALLGFFVYCLKMKIGSPIRQKQILRQDITSPEAPLHNINDQSSTDNFLNQHFQDIDDWKAKEVPYMDLSSILAATDNFFESNMLGQGGFGPVYKGKLSDGREIAVKRLSSCSHQGSQEFTNEVLLIMKLQHKNLVRLLGFCVNGEEKLLVYEYMPNGSLDVILFDPTKCAQLNWSRRLNIINGIARGMLYLHEDSRLRIIHRDLKASNILLDSNMDPKISDFGMARIFVGSEGEASTCRVVGTYGYMAPEYAMEGLYSVKSDVFSFGVLLLEIITGTRNAGFQQSKRASSLISYAWQLWNEGKSMELMDPTIADSCCPDEFIKCVYLGLLCVQEDACERPTMSAVMVMLKSGSEALRQPERPAFSWGISNDYYEEINVDSLSFDKSTISSERTRGNE